MNVSMNQSKNNYLPYGGYSKKDRKQYLLKDNLIILERFTLNPKDYTLPELKYTYTRYVNPKKPSSFKKKRLF